MDYERANVGTGAPGVVLEAPEMVLIGQRLVSGQKVVSLERIIGQLEVCQLVKHLLGHLRAIQSEQMAAESFAELLGLVKILLVIESVEQTAVFRHIHALNAMKMAVWTESKTFGLLKRILEK